jgi:macrolide transport system ATP-binding/permease protein
VRRLRAFVLRLRAFFTRTSFERGLSDEVQFHLELQIEDNVRAGMTPQAARREAVVQFGGVEVTKEAYRERHTLPWLEHLGQDVRYAARMMRRNPALTVVAVLSLGVGIGVNVALFTAINAALLQQPTVANPDSLVGVAPGYGDEFGYDDYRDLRDSGLFADVVGSNLTRLNLRSGTTIEPVVGLIVTGNFFDGLGIVAGRGRVFTAREAPESGAHLVVLSHSFWLRRFQGNADLLGDTIDLNGEQFLVLGILPETYRPVTAFVSPDVYVPVSGTLVPELKSQSGFGVTVLARLRENGSTAQALAAVTTFINERPGLHRPNDETRRPAEIFPVVGMHGREAPPGALLFGTLLGGLTGLVLLIACANVAGLLLARAAVRQRELAVRVALGASRRRLTQLLLAESLLLSALGGGLGLILALWLVRALSVVSLPGQAPVQFAIRPDLTLYAFGVALAFVTGLLCGIVPAFRATSPDAAAIVQQGEGRGITGRMRLRNTFVVGQIAAAVCLLVISSLFFRSLVNQATADVGFDIDHGVVASFDLEPNRYSTTRSLLFAQQVIDRLVELPFVRSAAVASIVPLSGDTVMTRLQLQVEGRPARAGTAVMLNHVGPRYFDTMQIGLLRGREFQPTDRAGTPPVVIVSEAFAHTYFSSLDALGKRVGFAGQPQSEIVGVVENAAYGISNRMAQPVLYYPWAQLPADATAARPLVVHLRVEATPTEAVQPVRLAIADLDRTVAVDVRTLEDATSFDLSVRRAGSVLMGMLGALGLLLAMIGLYGVMAYTVASRTVEIGIRMALGASARLVLWRVMAQGLRLVALGVGIGTALSLAVSRFLTSFLAGLSPTDPIAFGSTAMILILVGACASYLPARRATHIDPMVCLRRD